MLFRPLSNVTIALTVIFVVVILLIPQFAPDTAVLSYYEITPEWKQAIHLLDVSRGLTSFSGLVTSLGSGNFSLWSTDGETIATMSLNPPATFDLLDLTTGERQSYPMQSPAGAIEWQSHPTKFGYQSILNDGSLIVLDRETGQENGFFENVNVNWMHWLPESDTLIVMVTDKRSRISTLYEIDLTTNDITLLRENFVATHLEVLDDPFRILYSTSNQLITFSPDAPDDETILMTLDEAEFSGWYHLPATANTWIFYTSLRETWQLNMQTSDLQRIGDAPENADSWRVYPSPDGSSLATLDRLSDTANTIHITRDGEQIDVAIPDSVVSLLWSPDGRYILAPTPSNSFISIMYLVDTESDQVKILDQVFVNLFWQPAPE